MNTLKSLADEIEFDVDDYKLLLQAFIDQTDIDLKDIKDNINAKNTNVISERIHSIKGAALNLGLNDISEVLKHLSRLNKEGEFHQMEMYLNSCLKEVDTLKRLLKGD